MEQLVERQNNEILATDMVINILHQKFYAQEIIGEITSTLKEFQNLCGRIFNIDNDSIYFKRFASDEVVLKIHIAELYKIAKSSKQSDLIQLCENTLNYMTSNLAQGNYLKSKDLIDAIRKKLDQKFGETQETPSTLGNKASDIIQYGFIKTDQSISARMITSKYTKSIYRQIFAGNPESKAAVREIFEGTMQHLLLLLFETDLTGNVLGNFDSTIEVLNEHLEDNYDADTLEALGLLKSFVIEIANEVKKPEINTSYEIGTSFFAILPTNIRVKRFREGEASEELTAVLEGNIINNSGSKIIFANSKDVFEIEKFKIEFTLTHPEVNIDSIEGVKESILKIIEKDLETLNPDSLQDKISLYIDDCDLILDNPLYKVLVFLRDMEDKKELIEIIKYLINKK